MQFNETQKNIAKFLNKVSPIYQKGFLSKKIFREQFENDYQALVCFLENYAYTRQGAAVAYPKIALNCISRRYSNGDNWRIPTKDDATDLWEDYKNIAKEEYNLFDNKTGKVKVNETRNPMNANEGIIDKMAKKNVSNITIYIKDHLSHSNTIEAYKFIKSIQGVGEKISSFYLRDIVYLSRLNEENISDLHLLQPIDTWLEQTLKILFGSKVPKKLNEKQNFIVNLCKKSNVSSIYFNQGAWVFGSQIAGEFENFQKALNNYDHALYIIDDYVKEKEDYLHVVKNTLESLRHMTNNN